MIKIELRRVIYMADFVAKDENGHTVAEPSVSAVKTDNGPAPLVLYPHQLGELSGSVKELAAECERQMNEGQAPAPPPNRAARRAKSRPNAAQKARK